MPGIKIVSIYSVIMLIVTAAPATAAGPSGMPSGLQRDALAAIPQRSVLSEDTAGEQVLINLKEENGKITAYTLDYTWTESQVAAGGLYPLSSQGYVDVITGQDGNLYCAFYDDRTISGYANHKSIYVRKSVDGGATWENIDGGATGFALAYLGGLGDARPSVEVWETTPGSYRIAVIISAGDESLVSYDAVVLWKELGLGNDWTSYFLGNSSYDYALPRLKAVPRPSNPSRNRLVAAFVLTQYGYYLTAYSDTDAASFGASAAFISDIDAWEMWRPDMEYDAANDRLYCIWSMSEYNDPSHLPKTLIALSPDRSPSWYLDIFSIGPLNWNVCAEAEAALSANPVQTDPTLMVVYSAQPNVGDTFHVHCTFQYLNVITEGGGTWDIDPPGHPVFPGTVYTDTDGDNTMPAIWADDRLNDGGYRVAILDETSVSSSRMLYTESTFDQPAVWMTPDEVSAPGADPARQGASTGVSSGVAVGSGTYADTRIVIWPDYRNGADSDIYCARYPDTAVTPTATSTQAPTETPTPSATPTAVPPPIPATSGIGILVLLGGVSLLSAMKRR
ncbi:MAG TPA: hypothetical protein PLV45_12295 [bacterium]|nr:hypothetical protein [bacterium]